MSPILDDDCFGHDGGELTHDAAIALIGERLAAVAGIEEVALAEACGRVLAEPVVAPRDEPKTYPAGAELFREGEPCETCYVVVEGRLALSRRGPRREQRLILLGPGEAARVFTGAPMPDGADTCVMEEHVAVDGDAVTVPAGVRPGANTRASGEDAKAGETLLAAGVRLRPQDVAAVASTGAARVRCRARLRVALISTGDEVVRPGEALAPGQIYDANHPMLAGLLAAAGATVDDRGILPDRRDTVERAVRAAASQADVILTTGGASRGEGDHVVATIRALGRLHGWRLAVKPGRPLAIGQIGDTVAFGLPGNPVAAFVTFLLYAQPMLAVLQGAAWRPPRRYPLPAGFAVADKRRGRREFWRGWIEDTEIGPVLRKYQRDGSALISSLRQASGLIEAGEEVAAVGEGDLLGFIPFSEFGI